MNKLVFTCVSSFLLLIAIDTPAQEWIRYFNGDTNFAGRRIIEHYDKGYIIAGDKETSGTYTNGWLCKTDINGFFLWDKSFQDIDPDVRVMFTSFTELYDGGITLIGERRLSLNRDPIIVNVNACGQKQWCKIYDANTPFSFGYDIISLPGGGYIALIINWVDPHENKPVWLFRLDDEGEIIWQQYFPQDTIFYSSIVSRIFLGPDTTLILTGSSYTTNPGQITPAWLRPLIARVDLDGITIFELSWGRNDHLIGIAFSSTTDVKGSIYSGATHARPSTPYGDSPCLLKTSNSGNEIFYKDLIDTTKSGGIGTIAWFQDSTMILNGAWTGPNPGDTSINGVFKTDTLGNILLQKELFGFTSGFSDCISTFNNKAVFIGPFGLNYPYWQTVMIKLNSKLEYDSIYTTPFTYDSLCPYPIVSDTIPLDDCEVIIAIDDPIEHPEKTRLHVYPNPAMEKITVEMPEYLVRSSGGQAAERTSGQADRRTGAYGLTATTFYHQWDKVRLEVFDLFGRLMYCEGIPQEQKSVELKISTWPQGMYVARLVFMNDVVGSVKFVVTR